MQNMTTRKSNRILSNVNEKTHYYYFHSYIIYLKYCTVKPTANWSFTTDAIGEGFGYTIPLVGGGGEITAS